MSKINATCTWGDGPDVLVSLFDKKFMLYPSTNVFVHGSFCLTAVEARALANELNDAAKQAEALDTSLKEHEELNRLVETYTSVICPHCEQNWVKHGPCPCV